MFVESCCRLYFKDNRKHDCRGSVSRLAITKNKSLVNETGKLKWVASFGVGNYALTLSMKRLTKDDEYPDGRFLTAETQAEWDSISKFHSNDPKSHSFYDKYFCCWIFCLLN